MANPAVPEGSFISDVKELRRRAREHLEKGAVTQSYEGDLARSIELLNNILASELDSVKAEFTEHAADEQQHADWVAERINQLGGKPNFNPDGMSSRAASQYVEGKNLVDMIKENLIAERIAVEHYQEVVRYFANRDPTTRHLIEKILAKEEEHANDMHDLLVSHEGKPML